MRYNIPMKKLLYSLIVGLCVATLATTPAYAVNEATTASELEVLGIEDIATDSAISTESTRLATPSAEVVEKIQEKKDQDITEPSGKQKTKLESYLDEKTPQPLTWHNFLQHAIRIAVSNGLSANVVVLILLFPVIASIISITRHLIGLQSFGIYTPAVLSVAFVSTGIIVGISIFFIILATTLLFRKLFRILRLQFLPRTAMLLWGMSITILAIFVLSSSFGFTFFLNVTIFPLLILMLLTENFIETQLASSQSQALRLTIETALVAVVCSLIISLEFLQKMAILNPELLLVVVPIINIIVGRYSGLRLFEYIRFRSIIDR